MKNGEKYKTVEERKEPFRRFCNSRLCEDCEIFSRRLGERECGLFWLDLEAEEEKPDNCPFCGTPTKAEFHQWEGENKFSVMCDFCGYSSGYSTEKQEAIARHNALCRRVKGVAE